MHQITVIPPLLRKKSLISLPSLGILLGYLLNSGYVSEITQWQAQHPFNSLTFFLGSRSSATIRNKFPLLHLHKIDDTLFLQYMVNCKAYATTAGRISM